MLSFDPQAFPYPSKRHLTYGKRGMVATSHPAATEAGLHMLRSGGNAVDAVLAAAAALCVVDPASNGIGGDLFAIVSMQGKPLVGLNSSGFAPALMDAEAVRRRGYEQIPLRGWLSVTVPGAPAGWAALCKRFARLPMETLFRPAVELSEGYALSMDNAGMLNDAMAEGLNLKAEFPEVADWMRTFNPDGHTFRPGELFAPRRMGKSLLRIAQSGAEDFYRGEMAAELDRYCRENGGLLRKEDLAAYAPQWVQPISTAYGGCEVWELPPNGQGMTALLALNILENFSFAGRDDARTLHLQMEAIKLAFADALHYITDPRYLPLEPEKLLSKAYGSAQSARIGELAQTYAHGTPAGSDTVYLCAADGEGNSVSLIQSVFKGFGSMVTIPSLGFSLQNRGACFSMAEGHANRVAPRKQPYHTIIPGFLTQNGAPLGPFGIMGGYMQPQAHTQFLMNLLTFGLNPQSALDAPRFCWKEGLSFEMEPGYPQETIRLLREKGHDITIAQNRGFGRGQCILRTADGTLVGATEPRGDGCIVGY